MLVLTILKIIGIILLVILGLLLAAVLTVLLVPLRYRIWLEYRESLKAKVSVSWLLRMAEVKAVYDGELDVDARVLWFHPLRGDGDEAVEPEIDEMSEAVNGEDSSAKCQKSEGPVSQTEGTTETTSQVEELQKSERAHKESGQSQKASVQSAEQSSQKPEKQQSDVHPGDQNDGSQTTKADLASSASNRWKRISDSGKRFFNRIRHSWNGIHEKITRCRDFVTNERNQRVFFMILGQSKRLLHHILPKKVLLQAEIGFDDPATTGNVLAAVSILYAFYGDRIQVTPYFDQEILQGEFEASGRICLGVLLYLAAKVWFHKDFRMLRKEYKDGGI